MLTGSPVAAEGRLPAKVTPLASRRPKQSSLAAVGTISSGILRYATKQVWPTRLLQVSIFWPSMELFQLGLMRIVALENVASSSPVGHPPRYRIGKPNMRKWKRSRRNDRVTLTRYQCLGGPGRSSLDPSSCPCSSKCLEASLSEVP
jgi:hypothetical protein